jgi:hypothetical protein
MNRWTLTAHRRRPDEGASLVLAMIFVMFVGLVVTTMLSFGSTALVSTTATAARGQADYDVDGALQAAINSIRQSRYDNALGESCLNSTTTLPYPGGRVAVTCAPRADSGAAGGPAGRGRSTMPDWALLALGTDPEEGIHQRGNNTFWVRGGKVQSNAGITVAGWACPASPQPPVAANCAQLYDSSDQVIAAQACRGGISSPASPPYVCGSGAVVADPGYSQPAVVGAGTRTVPNCSATTPGSTPTSRRSTR